MTIKDLPMFSKNFLKVPCLIAAFFAAGLICLASPGWAGLLLSRTESAEVLSRTDLEREMVIETLISAGWNRDEATGRVAGLTEGEIQKLAEARMTLVAGGEDGQSGKALRVGLAIVIVLTLITGIYLFSQ